MPKRNLSDLKKTKNFEKRQEFIDCIVEGLSVDDTMMRVGIGRSTVYKWRKQWEADKDSWNRPNSIRTKAKRFRKLTHEETRRYVIDLALENPNWGAARIAALAGDRVFFTISTGTVHNYLAAEGLSTRIGRINRLYDLLERGLPLTQKQLKFIEGIYPFVVWGKQWRSPIPGQRLVVGMVRPAYSSPVLNSLISIVVDAHDGRAFAGFGISQRPLELGLYSYLRGVVESFAAQGYKVKEVVTQTHYLYDRSFRACDIAPSFDECLKSMGIKQRFEDTIGNKINPLVKHVWEVLRPYLFGELREMCDCKSVEDVQALNKEIQRFLDSKHPIFKHL